MLADVRHFPVGSLFDDNMIATWNGQIDGGERCCNVEWYAVMLGDHRNLVCANFVGCVAVSDNLYVWIYVKTMYLV